MSDYSWVSAFKAVSEWIADYEDRQPDLVQILRDIGVKNGLDDLMPDGSEVPLTVIDPFTFFATFMKYGEKNRVDLFTALLDHIDLPISAPHDFDGVPSAQPLKVWLFPYAKERTPDMVPSLWKLFRQMRSGVIDGELFDEILRIPHTGFAKLTECLFYLKPDKYFPVDAQTKPWLDARGIEVPSQNWDSYQKLLGLLADSSQKPYYEISHLAWLENRSKAFSAEKADLYLSDRYEGTRSGTTHLLAFRTETMRELAFDPGNNPATKKIVKIFLDARPPSSVSPIVEPYLAEKSRNHHLTSHAPTLSQGKSAWLAEVNSIDQLTALCNWYESVETEEISEMKNRSISGNENFSLNSILYGPPGTGKTYSTLWRAVSLADPDWFSNLIMQELSEDEQRSNMKSRYEELCADGRISFTTFHQSFSYEDFIEGIRASSTDDKGLAYGIEDGVFKDIARRAAKSVAGTSLPGLSAAPSIWKISIGRGSEKAMRDKCINDGEARIGWNNTGDLTVDLDDRTQDQRDYWNSSLSERNRAALNDFSESIQMGDVLLCLKDAETVQAVGIVTSAYAFDDSARNANGDYAHVRKVDWILKNIDLNILSLNDGRRMVQQTVYPLTRISWNSLIEELRRQKIALPDSLLDVETSGKRPNYVLIIDEINRGNISRIFGELITLLEPDKRISGSDERSVILPYSKESFAVPDNLYVLGTMNTADKSLAQLDIALRRRFEFIELMPKPELLAGIVVHGVDLSELLDVLNQRIEVLLDRDHMLGHAYFWPLKVAKSDAESVSLLASIFENRIIPLLQEYFFADWERIGWVLNDPNKLVDAQFIQIGNVGKTLGHLFPGSIANELNDRRYKINHLAFTNPAAYQGILSKAGVAP